MPRDEKKQSKLEAALKYAKEGWPVLPLHSTRGGECTCRKKACGSKGKHPRTKNGIKNATNKAAEIRAWWERWPDANIGLVTGKASGRMVLDVDVKKGKRGDESLQSLIDEHGPLPNTLKAVTASGGWHYVFRIPKAGIQTRTDVRKGIDLLADDHYFVASPSVIEGKPYNWLTDAQAAPCPSWVAQLRKEDEKDVTVEGRIAKIIKEILPLGKERKGNWLVRCPFPPHEDTNPSFEIKLSDGVFNCWSCSQSGCLEDLYAHVKNVTKDEARRIIYPPPGYIEELNKTHAVITDFGGKCVIMNESQDPIDGWQKITFSSLADLRGRYRSRRVFVGQKSSLLADAWFAHRDRREYRGIVFSPGKAAPGYYNLWQGFPVVAQPGDCPLYLQHISNIICSKNAELYEYVLNWMALGVQRPWQRPEVALVLRGNEGVGKGVFCKYLGKLYGPHFKPLNNTRQLVGNFNAHLANALLVFADEALWAGDKQNEGVLKALITESKMPLEYKGKDLVLVDNHIHLIISTNNDWAVPAGPRARRFCMMDVSEEHMQDGGYFGPIEQEMDNGGLEGLFHMLLNRNIEKFDPRKFPVTDALNEMKRLTMAGTPAEFWYSILERGTLDPYDSQWKSRVTKESLHQQYCEWAKCLPRKSTQTQLGMALKKLCPHVKDCLIANDLGAGSKRGWDFSELKRCRDAFCRFFNWVNHDWDDGQGPESICQVNKPKGVPPVAPSAPSSLAALDEYDNFDRFHGGKDAVGT